jgi:hypothetical protein
LFFIRLTKQQKQIDIQINLLYFLYQLSWSRIKQ